MKQKPIFKKISFSDCYDNSSWTNATHCFNVYPNANLDLNNPSEAQKFCQNQMKVDGQVMQYNGKTHRAII